MSSNKPSVGIKTAKREEKEGGAFYLDLETTAAWINNLPRGSVGKTAQQLFSSLNDINKIKLDYEDRFDYLELIREPLLYTMATMEKHYNSENFPLIKKQQKIASLSREFCLLMMMGYIIGVEELLEDYNVKRDKKFIGLLIHRAISYISHFILISYQLYMLIPPDIWMKLHKLYLFAEENNVSNIKITDEQYQHFNQTTIFEEYARILLLASASPYHMRSGEVGDVYINIERWMELISIHSVRNKIESNCFFVVDVSSEASALKKSELKGKRKNNLRVIVIDEMMHKIDRELQSSEVVSSHRLISANLSDAALSHDLLRRLKCYWAANQESLVDSGDIKRKVSMVVGISATHNLVKEISKYRGDDARDIFSRLSGIGSENIQMKAAPPRHIEKEKKATTQEIKIPSKVASVSENWLLISDTHGEYCLQCDDACAQQLQVGEVVGIRQSTGSKDFVLGIISWLRVYGNNMIKLGIKQISTSAMAIELRADSDNSELNQAQRALLLPVKKEVGQLSSIVVFSTLFKRDMPVMINIFGKEILVKLTHKFINSGFYAQYQYEPLINKPTRKKNKSPVKHKKANSGFDEIWDSI